MNLTSRVCSVLAAVALTAALLPLTAGAALADDTSGTLSGTVLDFSGAGLAAGTEVTAHLYFADNPNNRLAGFEVASDGHYEITDIPAGDYKVQFFDYSYTYAPVMNGDGNSFAAAPTLHFAPGVTRIEDARLKVGAVVTGKVTDSAGKPVALTPQPHGSSARVSAIPASGQSLGIDETGSDTNGAVKTDGSFRLSGLPSGSYTLKATAVNYVGKISSAVTLTRGTTTAFNVTLLEEGEAPSPSATPDPAAAPDPAVPAVTAEPVRAAQTVGGSVVAKSKAGKVRKLPARSTGGAKIQWRSLTPKRCSISGHKVTAKKKGTCRLVASAKATDGLEPLVAEYAIAIKK